MSKELNRNEAQKEFLRHVRVMIDYWENNIQDMPSQKKLEGLAFSILTALDGCALDLPGYAVIPICSKKDIKSYIAEGQDYYEEFTNEKGCCDIAGDLHENLFK